MRKIKWIQFVRHLIRLQQEWKKINEPYGRDLGYPQCCIDAFCSYPPVVIRWLRIKKRPILGARMQYTAGCIDGKYTGFIPCQKHAKLIMSGKITLESLIKNRMPFFEPFPLEGDPDGLIEILKKKQDEKT